MVQIKNQVPTPQVIGASDTLGQYFLRNYERWGAKKVAMRHKRDGVWHEYTWADSYEHVRDFGLGLLSLGLRRGDKVALLGNIEPELYWGMFACWSVGAATIGCFVGARPEEVQFLIEQSHVSMVLVQDQTQIDKLLGIKANLPQVKQVIWWNPRGMRELKDSWLMSFQDVCALGRDHAKQQPRALEDAVAATTADDLAILAQTSGTTGLPKVVCHSHRSTINWVGNALRRLGAGPDDRTVTIFPITGMADPLLGSVAHLCVGLCTNSVEKPENLEADLRNIAPSYILYGPQQWEGIAAKVRTSDAEAGFLKRWWFGLSLKVGYRYASFRFKGRRPPMLWRALHFLPEKLVLRQVRDRFGLAQLKKGLSGGSPLGAQTFEFVHALGLNVVPVYGSTEMGIAAAHGKGEVRPDSVGTLLRDFEATISPQGELLVRSPSLFVGYYQNPEATAQSMRDGWYHTGDAAHIDERGQVFIYGRLSEVEELASGAKYSPQFVEAQLRFGVQILEALAVGGKQREYVTAVITGDSEAIAGWAERRGITYTTVVDLCQRDEIADLVSKDILRVNQAVPKEARIRAFVIVHQQYGMEEGEVVRPSKLKRGLAESRYATLIEAVYAGQSEVQVRTLATYKDGHTGTAEAKVKVRTVPRSQV